MNKKVNISQKGIWVIGDVHGEYEKLRSLLTKIPKDENVCFVGDLIDRGERSAEVVNLVISQGYHCVKGNHELMMENAISFSANEQFWKLNGGNKTLKSYHKMEKECNKDNKIRDFLFIRKLPYFLYFEIEGYKPLVISHSYIFDIWVDKDFEYLESDLQRMIWKHFEKENTNQKGEKEANIYNIFGHTIVKNEIIEDNYAMIDTGAYLSKDGYYGRLTALHYPSFKVISVG